MRGDGLFFLIVGIFLVIGGIIARHPKSLVIARFVSAGIAMAPFGARVGTPFGIPATFQVASLVAAGVLDMASIPIVPRRLEHRGERAVTLMILLVVALHFFVMVSAFGPAIAVSLIGNRLLPSGSTRNECHTVVGARIDGNRYGYIVALPARDWSRGLRRTVYNAWRMRQAIADFLARRYDLSIRFKCSNLPQR